MAETIKLLPRDAHFADFIVRIDRQTFDRRTLRTSGLIERLAAGGYHD